MVEKWTFYGTPVQFSNAVLSYWNLKIPKVPCRIDGQTSNNDQVVIHATGQAGAIWITAHTIPGGRCNLIMTPHFPETWNTQWGQQWQELVTELRGQGWRIEANTAVPNEVLKDWFAQKHLEDREREPEMLKFLAESKNRFSVEEIERAVVNSLSRLSPQQFTLKKVLDGPPVIIYDVTYHGDAYNVEGKIGVYGRYRIEPMKDGTVNHYFESSYSPLWSAITKMVYVELRDRGVLQEAVPEHSENIAGGNSVLIFVDNSSGDKIAGDKTTFGNISDSSNIAIGTGASANSGADSQDKTGDTAVPNLNNSSLTPEECKYRSELLQILKQYFNNEEDLRTLYFDLGWTYGQFESGGIDTQARALVERCFNKTKQNDLADLITKYRPNIRLPKSPE